MQKSAYYKTTACEYVSLRYEILEKRSFDILSSNRISRTNDDIIYCIYYYHNECSISVYAYIIRLPVYSLSLDKDIMFERLLCLYIYIYRFFCTSFKCFDYCCTEAYDHCILIEP